MRLVSIARSLPFPGIPHAGGEFYRRHIGLLAAAHEVVVIVPRRPENEKALRHFPDAPYRRLLVRPDRPYPRAMAALRHQFSRAAPLLVARGFRREILTDEYALAELRRADCIELQWFDMIVLAPALRRMLPTTPILGVFHDVVSQGYRRTLRARAAPVKSRAVAAVSLPFSIALERQAMRTLDCAVVLSDKDRALLARRGGSARTVVLSPPLDDEAMPRTAPNAIPSTPLALFVGALWRPENEDAAMWLVNDIWPRVRAAVPGAQLTIAGAGPTPALMRRVAEVQDVEITGYVSDLGPYYRRAQVAVAPIRRGAGVKLKTVVAMLWGVPVVATRVGAEGVTGPDVFACVVDDAEHFADAVVQVLRQPDSVLDVRLRAHAWTHQEYSLSAYRQRMEGLYRLAGPSAGSGYSLSPGCQRGVEYLG